MPDITPVKKLPDGFTYEGINQYGLPIYFYLGKPCQPASAAMPNYNIPVNFANMSIPGPPPLLSSPPPAGNGSNSQNAPPARSGGSSAAIPHQLGGNRHHDRRRIRRSVAADYDPSPGRVVVESVFLGRGWHLVLDAGLFWPADRRVRHPRLWRPYRHLIPTGGVSCAAISFPCMEAPHA